MTPRHCYFALTLFVACKGKDAKPNEPPPAEPPKVAADAAPTPTGTVGPGGGAITAITGTLSNAVKDAVAMTCAQVARDVKGNEGTSWYMSCPPGCNEGSVWGTDLYTDDSSVCHSAIHAGGIKPDKGGTVLVTWTPGQMLYAGSQRNNVTSGSWGRWGRSFFVQTVDDMGRPTTPAIVPTPPGVAKVGCDTPGNLLEGEIGAKWRVLCPPNCTGAVYGTEIYTKDSALCAAAIHAGLIAADKAGEVDVVIEGAQNAFKGSARNGITSIDWGDYPGAYRFAK